MPRSRPPYPAEFRARIIELARAGCGFRSKSATCSGMKSAADSDLKSAADSDLKSATPGVVALDRWT